MAWNIIVSIDILMYVTLASVFLVNKTRIEQLLFFVVYFLLLFANPQFVYTLTSSLIFMILLTDKNINITEPKLEFSLIILLCISVLNIFNEMFSVINFSMLKHSQSIILLYISILLYGNGKECDFKFYKWKFKFSIPNHKNNIHASILIIYNIFWSSYAISWEPIALLLIPSIPLACLSLALFLLHYVRTDFKGSIVHWVYCKIRHIEYDPYKTKFSSKFLVGLRGSD